ncbi:MAG: nitronate monooxygenase, partial [Myxococcota bacterium]
VPVVCGPMYPGSNPELVAAVSAAGGLGVVQPISLTHLYGHDFREGLQFIKRLTDKPFGVNFTLMPNRIYQKRMEQWVQIAIEEGVRFFLTSLGRPDWVVKRAHEHGIVVYHDVSTAKFAKIAVDAGVDGLNCVNFRGGGQTGSCSAEQLAEELRAHGLPLICAGGVSGPESFTHALSLGYAGTQVGTRFLATPECKVTDAYKDAIVGSSESDIVWTNKLAGVNSSVIRTPDVEAGGLRAGPVLGFLLRQRQTKKIARMLLLARATGRYKKAVTDAGYQYWQAGKGVDEIDGVLPVDEVMSMFGDAYRAWAASGPALTFRDQRSSG